MIYQPVLILRPDFVRIHDEARVDSFVKLEGEIRIDRWVHVASFCHLGIGGGILVLAEGAAVASGVKILTGSNTMFGVSMSAAAPKEMQVVTRASVLIDEHAFLGVNSVVMPGVRVGKHSVVGANSLVRESIPDGEVWVGSPARKLRDR